MSGQVNPRYCHTTYAPKVEEHQSGEQPSSKRKCSALERALTPYLSANEVTGVVTKNYVGYLLEPDVDLEQSVLAMSYIMEGVKPCISAESVKFSINLQQDSSSLVSEKVNVMIKLTLGNGTDWFIKRFSDVSRDQAEQFRDKIEQCYLKKDDEVEHTRPLDSGVVMESMSTLNSLCTSRPSMRDYSVPIEYEVTEPFTQVQMEAQSQPYEMSIQTPVKFELSAELRSFPKPENTTPKIGFKRNQLGYVTTGKGALVDPVRQHFTRLLNCNPQLCNPVEIYLSKAELSNLLRYDRLQNPRFTQLFDDMCNEADDHIAQISRHNAVKELGTLSGATFMEETVFDRERGTEYLKHSVVINKFKYVLNIVPIGCNLFETLPSVNQRHNEVMEMVKSFGYTSEKFEIKQILTCLQAVDDYKRANGIIERHLSQQPDYVGLSKMFISETLPTEPYKAAYKTKGGLYLIFSTVADKVNESDLSALKLCEHRKEFTEFFCEQNKMAELIELDSYNNLNVADFRLSILKNTMIKPEYRDQVIIRKSAPKEECLAVYKTTGGLYLAVKKLIPSSPPASPSFGDVGWIDRTIDQLDYPALNIDDIDLHQCFCKPKQELSVFDLRMALDEINKYSDERLANYRISIMKSEILKPEFQQHVRLTKSKPEGVFQNAYKTSGGLYLIFKK